MWLLFSILSGILFTILSLLTRYILKGDKDAWAYSFYFSFVGALVALPFVINNPKFSNNPSFWLLIIFVGGLIVLHNYLNFKSSNYLEASVVGSISKFRLLWVLLIGVILFDESLDIYKIIGTLFTVLAGLVIYAKYKKVESKKGLVLIFSATFVYAAIIGFYKLLFEEFNSVTLTFFVFLIPALINLVVMPNSLSRITKMAKVQGKAVFLATFFGGLANLAMNHALSIGEASKVLVIIESFLVILLMGEYFFLKEKSAFGRKLLAVVLATIGAVLIRMAS